MAIFESLAQTLKKLAVGDQVKVTLRPELGRFPNPLDGLITAKDEAGNLLVASSGNDIKVAAGDILSITKMSR